MKNTLKIAAIAGALMLPALQANAATITFEDLAEGATLSNQYAALGILFSPNAFSGAGTSTSGEDWATNTDMTITASDVGALGGPSLVSGKLLHSFGGWLDEDGDPSFLMTFTTAINAFSADFAGVFTGPDVTLFAYNGGTLIGTVNGPVSATTSQFTLSFAAANITSIAVRPGTFDDWVGVDNISFTQVAVGTVPEPASWAMMLVGFGAIGAAIRPSAEGLGQLRVTRFSDRVPVPVRVPARDEKPQHQNTCHGACERPHQHADLD